LQFILNDKLLISQPW